MKKLFFGLGLLIPFLISAQQVPRSIVGANGQQIGFYEFKPADYNSNANAKFPLIIFLHGIGERGDGTTGLPNVLGVGIPNYINRGATMRFTVNGVSQTFLVLSPQLNYNYGYWPNFYVDEMLNYAKNNLRVDVNRIYLTGLSLGGGGVWRYASTSAANAQQFAAIAPICGTCDFSNLCNVAQNRVAVWAFHALDDGVVGVGCTQSAISALNSCAPQIVPQVTYYPTGNHYIWDQAYDSTHNVQSPQNLFEWFLTNSRSGAGPAPITANILPVANAGLDQTIALPGNAVNLSGSSSYDQDGSITGYNWSQVSGPSTGIINNVWAASINVANLVAGTYVFRLKVSDNVGATATDDVQVTVGGTTGSGVLPVALAGADQAITLPTNKAWLVGSSSYVTGGGTISNYSWTQVNGPSQATLTSISTTNVEAGNLIAGTYTFRLSVTSSGGSNSDDMNVVVGGTSTVIAPVANAGSNQSLLLPTNSTSLNGTSSSGNTLRYSWSEMSGPAQYSISNATVANPTVSNLVAGAYTFKLTVTDNAGATSSASVQVTVNNPVASGNPAVAYAGADQTLTLPTNLLILAGSGSYSQGGGSITSYVWNQVSGPNQATLRSVSASNVEASNLVGGVYVFRITVTNTSGNTSTDDVQVTVNGQTPTGSYPAVAYAGADQAITLPTSVVYLAGSGSYSQGGGSITSYVWSQVSGPSQATIRNSSPSNVEASSLIAGVYSFRLNVTNSSGNTATDDVVVTVTGQAPAGSYPAVAYAGADQVITFPSNSSFLTGSGSYSQGGGSITSYVWSQVSGPTWATIRSISVSNVEAGNLATGVYLFRLKVTNSSGNTSTDDVAVTVNGLGGVANPAAVASPLVDNSATAALSVYPNPAISTVKIDINNNITGNFKINFLDANGRSVATINATKTSTLFSQSVDISGLLAGTYVVEIRFNDGSILTKSIVKQ